MNMVDVMNKTAEVEWSPRLELWITDGSLSPHHQFQEASGFFRAWKKLYPGQGLGFKPNKFRSMVLKRGKVVDKFRFQVDGIVIVMNSGADSWIRVDSETDSWAGVLMYRNSGVDFELVWTVADSGLV